MDATLGFNQQVEELEKQVAAAHAKRAEVKGKLDLEWNALLTAKGNREGNVRQLADEMDDTLRGYYEHEIDQSETKIKNHTRMIESLEAALQGVDNNTTNLNAAIRQAMAMSEAEKRAHEFGCWKDAMYGHFREANGHLDGSRLVLGRLVMTAFAGAEKFGAEASQFLTAEAEQFSKLQNGLSNRGIERVYGWNDSQFQFLVLPSRDSR